MWKNANSLAAVDMKVKVRSLHTYRHRRKNELAIHTFTTALPVLPPRSISINASGVRSNPSVIVSSYTSRPSRIQRRLPSIPSSHRSFQRHTRKPSIRSCLNTNWRCGSVTFPTALL
uniref:Uncharacterized protein n=1 Tax=Anopheles christyi TaxID=43041 RepID=A0A182KIH8_9DIPT